MELAASMQPAQSIDKLNKLMESDIGFLLNLFLPLAAAAVLNSAEGILQEYLHLFHRVGVLP